MKQISTIGLDLAKNVFQIHGADAEGSTDLESEAAASRVAALFRKASAVPWSVLRPSEVPIIGRARSRPLGHDVRLIPPIYVKPFVKRGKTTPPTPRRSAKP